MSERQTKLTLGHGDRYTEYEIEGIIFRVGPPRLITWTEGDKTLCRFECETETIMPANFAARSGAVESQEGAG